MEEYFSQFMIRLSGPERSALFKLAKQERRELREQAAVIIRDVLVQRGFLEFDPQLQKQRGQDD